MVKILLVDDESTITEMIMLTLINEFDRCGVSEENLRFTILEAAPELSSLATNLDLAIIDGNINGYPGAVIVQHLRNAGMTGFIVTFSANQDCLADGTSAGADTTVFKTHESPHIFEWIASETLRRKSSL